MSQQQVVAQLETWRNPGEARVVIKRLDPRTGDLSRDELIRGGATFTITPDEREINQRMAYNPQMDFFRNGTLVPVALIEGSEMALEAATNPNLLSDGDMRSLLARKTGPAKTKADEAFLAKLADIENATTLGRLLALAEEEDAPVSRVRAIQARLAEVEGLGFLAPPDESPSSPDAPTGRPGAARPVTPR